MTHRNGHPRPQPVPSAVARVLARAAVGAVAFVAAVAVASGFVAAVLWALRHVLGGGMSGKGMSGIGRRRLQAGKRYERQLRRREKREARRRRRPQPQEGEDQRLRELFPEAFLRTVVPAPAVPRRPAPTRATRPMPTRGRAGAGTE